MGFREKAYAKVWSVEPVSDTRTKIRISISRKNKTTGEYEQDFSGYVMCVGSATAAKAAKLKEGDRIAIGGCDVTTNYDKEKKIQYTNFTIFSFENADDGEAHPSKKGNKEVDDGEVEDARLPF